MTCLDRSLILVEGILAHARNNNVGHAFQSAPRNMVSKRSVQLAGIIFSFQIALVTNAGVYLPKSVAAGA